MTHHHTPVLSRHLIAAKRRRRARPLIFHGGNPPGHMCQGHRTKRAAQAAEHRPAGPVPVCLLGTRHTIRGRQTLVPAGGPERPDGGFDCPRCWDVVASLCLHSPWCGG
jgi:hypothetical protein